MLGLAGLSLEVAAGLRPSDLSQELRRLALRMALWEPNQPPSWFDDLAVAEPEEARALLLPLLKQEIAADGSEARVLRLDQIGRSSARLQTLVAKDMTQELQAMEPKRLDVLQSALACIEGVDSSALDSLAPDRCRESEKEPKRLAIWLVAWMNRQGVAAADYLAAMLVGLDGSQAGEIVEEVLSRMWTWADERLGVTTFCIHKDAEALARLIPIAFAYVRRGEDTPKRWLDSSPSLSRTCDEGRIWNTKPPSRQGDGTTLRTCATALWHGCRRCPRRRAYRN
ncbi:MAG: hypothetical protein ABSF35_22585 [Polyangia bacterium]